MFRIEGDETGWWAVFDTEEDLVKFTTKYTIFDGSQYCPCCHSIQLHIDGERALGGLRKLADALKAERDRDTLSRNPMAEMEG